MPYWVVVDTGRRKLDLYGAYTEERAEERRDSFRDKGFDTNVYYTLTEKRSEAAQDIRDQRAQNGDAEELHRNFSSK